MDARWILLVPGAWLRHPEVQLRTGGRARGVRAAPSVSGCLGTRLAALPAPSAHPRRDPDAHSAGGELKQLWGSARGAGEEGGTPGEACACVRSRPGASANKSHRALKSGGPLIRSTWRGAQRVLSPLSCLFSSAPGHDTLINVFFAVLSAFGRARSGLQTTAAFAESQELVSKRLQPALGCFADAGGNPKAPPRGRGASGPRARDGPSHALWKLPEILSSRENSSSFAQKRYRSKGKKREKERETGCAPKGRNWTPGGAVVLGF